MIISIIFIVVAFCLGVFTQVLINHQKYFKNIVYVVTKQDAKGNKKAITFFYDKEYYALEKEALSYYYAKYTEEE